VPRWSSYEIPVDTGLFTPLGLQPTAVCRLGFNAAGRWLARHAISHRRLVAEHRTGLVVWSAQLAFDEPVAFFDADCFEMRVTGRVRGAGTQFECEMEVGGPLDTRARLQACCVPLRLEGDPALSGIPARLGPDVMAAFLPDEIEATPHRSPVAGLRAAIVRDGTALAQGRMPFVIHRHQCEVADQWFWPEAVSLAAGGREELVQADAERVPLLLPALRTPVRRLDLLFNRPFFLFDEGAVRSSAYEWEGRLVFIHELVGSEEDQPRALVTEQFSLPKERAWD
jgi:hypothetical protein